MRDVNHLGVGIHLREIYRGDAILSELEERGSETLRCRYPLTARSVRHVLGWSVPGVDRSRPDSKPPTDVHQINPGQAAVHDRCPAALAANFRRQLREPRAAGPAEPAAFHEVPGA